MDKIENLKKIKQLFDDGILSEKEFSEMKNEILTKNNNELKSSENELKSSKKLKKNKDNQQNKNGVLTVNFPGVWTVIDVKTKLFVNDELHSTVSTKNGFNIKLPIKSENITLKLQITSEESTSFEIEELDKLKNYTMIVDYSRMWGKYSSKFKFSENG
jgi:hypothetical protein